VVSVVSVLSVAPVSVYGHSDDYLVRSEDYSCPFDHPGDLPAKAHWKVDYRGDRWQGGPSISHH
jgi:hypothetical protein